MMAENTGWVSISKRMQKWFAEEKCCDMALEVANSSNEGDKVEIKAHSVVLGARSDYISACMNSGFEETSNKRIKLTLANGQEREDFRLLVKLSYAPTYISDGDKPLDRATLIRLASMAEAYEFHDAVDECMRAAGEGLTFVEATTCIHDLPQNLQNKEATKRLMEKAAVVLLKGLNDPSSIKGLEEGQVKEEMLVKAADIYAQCLGPVHQLFDPAPVSEANKTFDNSLVISTRIKELSLDALVRLLQSDALELRCEEEAYFLASAWIHQSAKIFKSHLPVHFRRLMSCMRFDHFSPAYIMNVVFNCPLLLKSKMREEVMYQAVSSRHYPCPVRDKYRHLLDPLPADRGEGKPKEWHINVDIPLADCIGMQPGTIRYFSGGLGPGYPVLLGIRHLASEGKEPTCGIYWCIQMHSQGLPDKHGVGMNVSWKCGSSGPKRSLSALYNNAGWGFADAFKKPWKEVVYEGSPYFPEGKMTIEATITDLVYWHEQNDKREEKPQKG